jgi:hypothetical protein
MQYNLRSAVIYISSRCGLALKWGRSFSAWTALPSGLDGFVMLDFFPAAREPYDHDSHRHSSRCLAKHSFNNRELLLKNAVALFEGSTRGYA